MNKCNWCKHVRALGIWKFFHCKDAQNCKNFSLMPNLWIDPKQMLPKNKEFVKVVYNYEDRLIEDWVTYFEKGGFYPCEHHNVEVLEWARLSPDEEDRLGVGV